MYNSLTLSLTNPEDADDVTTIDIVSRHESHIQFPATAKDIAEAVNGIGNMVRNNLEAAHLITKKSDDWEAFAALYKAVVTLEGDEETPTLTFKGAEQIRKAGKKSRGASAADIAETRKALFAK